MTHVTLSAVTFGSPLGRILAENVSADVEPGEMLMITGPNGAGKSTLLKIIVGDYDVFSGKVSVNLSRSQVAYLPQLQNVAFHLPLTLADVLRINQGGPLDVLSVEKIGLLSRSQLALAWNTASGGERKKTLLTRALLTNPKLLILDEPLNHLDQESRERVREVLTGFIREDATRSVILVSHDDPRFDGPFVVKQLAIGKNGEDGDGPF